MQMVLKKRGTRENVCWKSYGIDWIDEYIGYIGLVNVSIGFMDHIVINR